jgi:putative transposase
LRKEYWGRHFWAIGYGVWSAGNMREDAVKEYLEHHKDQSNYYNNDFILE